MSTDRSLGRGPWGTGTGGGATPAAVAPPAVAAGEQPVAGDLWVLREVADFPLEWLAVGVERGAAGRWLLVPADTNPAAGSADVRIAAHALAGPLTLRCGFPVQVAAGLLAGGVRSGRVEPGDRVRAEGHVAAYAARGAAAGPPLEREMDGDPEYVDWIESTIAPAVLALGAASAAWDAHRGGEARRGEAAERRRLPFPWARLAAAALLVLSLGLGWSVYSSRRQIEVLSRPHFAQAVGEVLLDGPSRGSRRPSVEIGVPPGASPLLLTVVLGAGLPAQASGWLEIQDEAGRPLWSGPTFPLHPGEKNLVVPRELLPPARRLLLVLYRRNEPVTGSREGGGEKAAAVLLEQRLLEVRTTAAPDR